MIDYTQSVIVAWYYRSDVWFFGMVQHKALCWWMYCIDSVIRPLSYWQSAKERVQESYSRSYEKE